MALDCLVPLFLKLIVSLCVSVHVCLCIESVMEKIPSGAFAVAVSKIMARIRVSSVLQLDESNP